MWLWCSSVGGRDTAIGLLRPLDVSGGAWTASAHPMAVAVFRFSNHRATRFVHSGHNGVDAAVS
jgi:hypothetical protein